jgi:hypothetical protein
MLTCAFRSIGFEPDSDILTSAGFIPFYKNAKQSYFMEHSQCEKVFVSAPKLSAADAGW